MVRWLRSLENPISLHCMDKKNYDGVKGKKYAMLPIKMELPPPLSITITQHRFSQLFGLSFQLLNLLQQSFMVRMLGPVLQEKDRKQRNQHISFFIGCKKLRFSTESQTDPEGLSLGNWLHLDILQGCRGKLEDR